MERIVRPFAVVDFTPPREFGGTKSSNAETITVLQLGRKGGITTWQGNSSLNRSKYMDQKSAEKDTQDMKSFK